MKKVKYLMLLLALFVVCPFNVFATSTLVYEINARKEGENSLWEPIYVSDIEEDKIIDIYDLAKFRVKDNTLTFTKDGELDYFDVDESGKRYIITNYNNTIKELNGHNGGKINIGGRGTLKVEKSLYLYCYYKAFVVVPVNGSNVYLNNEEGKMYYTENIAEDLVNIDSSIYKSQADELVKKDWSNLQKWNPSIENIPFDPSYVRVTYTTSHTEDYERKPITEEWVKAYVDTNLDITYLDDGVLFDGSKVLEDNGVVFKSEEELPENYTLKAEDIYEEKQEEVEAYNEKLEKKMMIGLFDISVNDGVKQVDIDSGMYTIRVPITDDIKDYTGYYVVYVKNGEIVDTIDAKVIDNKYIEFNTTHLSEYGIIADKPKLVTSISSDVTSVDFGTLKQDFTKEDSDKVLKKIRITNTGETTITINNDNPTETGPFGCYWFDPTVKIAPGEYMDISLRLSDGTPFASIAGSYSGTYTFFATNVLDEEDRVSITIDAKVKIESEYEKGDMNRNGKVDLQDIIILLKKYLKTLDITDDDLSIGDMDNDGSIGLKDIILLLRAYLNTN